MTKSEVDITPHPKILSVLGEIKFKPWQCIAELIDNSVDSFLAVVRDAMPIDNPIVQVDFGRDTVVVKDNGPGMSIEALEMAVKAGWSSHERFGSLGLYGVGFNIATARLGSLTMIWTTRAGDDTWYGLEIDLQKLGGGEKFTLPVHHRQKSDPSLSGTEVEISRIKTDWKDSFSNSNWVRTNVTERLASVYSTMLRDNNPAPIKFTLLVNARKVSAWEHCVWPADETVFRKSEGLVRPIQEFDVTFGKKYLSRSTGEFYDTRDDLAEEDIIEVSERVYGWLGIQRYADEKEYGVDILRNGRKIETYCKDIFDWEDEDGNSEQEYIIDDPSKRGRIVGEIHLDHGYVHYTKDRFEREHSSWKQLMQAVRHNESLTNRERHGYSGVNTSPLGQLFRVFRRNSPQTGSNLKHKDILFIKDNLKAKIWAREFRKGNPLYRDIKVWKEELEKSDEVQNTASSQKRTTGGSAKNSDNSQVINRNEGKQGSNNNNTGNVILDFGGQGEGIGDVANSVLALDDPEPNNEQSSTTEIKSNIADVANSETPVVQRTLLQDLSLHVTGIGVSGRSYDVEVYAIDPFKRANSTPAWFGRLTEKAVYEIEVDLQHPAFNSTSLQVRDAILAQLAYLITFEENASLGSQREVNYGDILVALRSRYATTDSLDANHLSMEIDSLGKKIISRFAKIFAKEEQRKLLEILPSSDIQRIELAHARGPQSVSVLTYFKMKHLAYLFQRQPENFFEAGCFNRPWTPASLENNIILLDEHRNRLRKELEMPLLEMGDFTSDSTFSSDWTRPYLALIRACVNRLKEYLADENYNA